MEEPLKEASGYVFYNVSKWTLTSLYNTATNNRQILLANSEEYLNGFSAKLQEIIERFELKSTTTLINSAVTRRIKVTPERAGFSNLAQEAVEA